ncbi:hypothetical protein AA0X95_04790 [Bacillus sp. 1P10SD]|uniref:hypothetical protein n=1 Tax=Bacillus sp. 1P10SD TaxID=3132265 RepID=UPI0039A47187
MDEKKLQIFGYVLFSSGTVLFGLMHLAIALYIPKLNGWSDPPGKFETVLNDIMGWVPYTLSLLFILIGGFIVIFDILQTKRIEKDNNFTN